MPENNCPKCGSPIDEGLNYCPKCGQKLSGGEMPFPKTPLPASYPPAGRYNCARDGGGGSSNVALMVIVAVLLVVIGVLAAFFFLGSGGSQVSPAASVQPHDTVVQQVIVQEKVVTPPAPRPKPIYFHDGHYNLEGSIYKGNRSAEVSFEFDIVDGKVSSGVYNNYKANDGSILVNLRKSGNTISGDGYDNIGAYFKFNFTAKGNGTYTGKLYFGGTNAMNLTLYD